jgi:hypothetical protein
MPHPPPGVFGKFVQGKDLAGGVCEICVSKGVSESCVVGER